MKKEILALSCAVALSMTACAPAAPAPGTQPTEITAAETEAVTTAVTETQAPRETFPEFDQTPEIEKTLLYDAGGLKITALSLKYEENQAALSIRMENTGDRDYFLSLNEHGSPLLSVNGRFVPVYLDYLSVFIDETMVYDILLDYDLLQSYGITSISEIAMCLTEGDFSTGVMKVSTGEKSKSLMKTLREREIDPPIFDSKESFFEAEDVKHTATIVADDAQGHRCIYLDFKNNGEKIRLLRMSEESLNGLHLIPHGDMITLMPGDHGQIILDLHNWKRENHLDTLGIEKVGTLQFQLSVLEQDTTILLKPSAVTMQLDEKIPDWKEKGRVISPEGEQSLYFLEAVEGKGGKTDFVFVWVNDSGVRFVSQVQSLAYEGKEIPAEKQSISLYGQGKAVVVITADLEAGKVPDSAPGTFTLNTYQRIGGSGDRASFDFTIQ